MTAGVPKKSFSGERRLAFKKLRRTFFDRPAIDVARELIGKVLVRRIGGKEYRARIIETEAYIGPHDLASHSSKGRTTRTEVMFGPPGRAYVYLIYGMYEMFNVVAAAVGDAQAVLIRGGVPVDGRNVDLSGPGRLARAFGITRQENGLDLTKDALFFVNEPDYYSRVVSTKRIGVEYAGEWQHALLRFVDTNHVSVKNPRSLRRSRSATSGSRSTPIGASD